MTRPGWPVRRVRRGVRVAAALDTSNFLSMGTAPWNSARHTDPKVDEDYARYAREMDPVKRKAMPRNLRSSVLTALHWDAVWLDK
jgi:hypothetical protein